jgi:hypothetical protein
MNRSADRVSSVRQQEQEQSRVGEKESACASE